MSRLRITHVLSVATVLWIVARMSVGCTKADLSVAPAEITIGNDLVPVTFDISTSSKWSIECENTWITAEPSSGSGGATITLTAVANSTGATRETSVLVSAGKAEGLVTSSLRVVQPAMTFCFSADTVSVPKEGGTVSFKILSDGPWSVLSDIDWVEEISPSSGLGAAEIKLTAEASTKRYFQTGNLIFSMGSLNAKLPVRLEPKENQSPEIPELILPSESETNLSVLPTFKWSCSDPDGDKLSYTLYITEDKTFWMEYETSSSTYTLTDVLSTQTDYWWKVVADDGNGRENSKSESAERRFSTGGRTHYSDGEWVLIHESTVSNPVNLVFTGDGYIKEDYRLGGNFISDMKEGVEALFSIEPYKGYESYFNIYAVAAYSSQRGMTITGQQSRNTRFEVTKTGSETTELSCNTDTVFMYAEKIPAVKGDLQNTAIFVMSNQNIYAGTCFMYLSGESIAIIPVCRLTDPTVNTDYASILLHEGGGHGFGQLADEYISYQGRSLPETGVWSIESVTSWQLHGCWNNISINKDTSDMPWSELTGQEGYSAITNPQGGLYYEFGVWRSEKQSCMIDNMAYYSAAQRLSIVKRIKGISGETFNIEDFMARDSVRTPSASSVKSSVSSFKPLGAPVLREHR